MQNNPVMRQDPTGMMDVGPGGPGKSNTDIGGWSTEDHNPLKEVTIFCENKKEQPSESVNSLGVNPEATLEAEQSQFNINQQNTQTAAMTVAMCSRVTTSISLGSGSLSALASSTGLAIVAYGLYWYSETIIFGANPYGSSAYSYTSTSEIPQDEAIKRQKAEDKINDYYNKPDNGKKGKVYVLYANVKKAYPCFTCTSGVMILEPGEIWKIGKSNDPDMRYSKAYLERIGVTPVEVFKGSENFALAFEKALLLNYWWISENRNRPAERGGRRFKPPGNKIYR